MLIKASKVLYTFFKQYFGENPSKLSNSVDFVSQKKRDDIFSDISGSENIQEKKNIY